MEKTETKETLENASNEAGTDKKVAATDVPNDIDLQQAAADVEESELMTKLKEELEGSKDKFLRLYSEFENFRKRTSKEKLELIQSANEQLLRNLLPIADDFERAENAFGDKNTNDLAGFFLIHAKFKKVMEIYGVKIMDVEKGSDFNADFHEAITQIPAPDPALKGKVVDVIEKGYVLNDKVIRYAKVVVGN